MRSDPEGAHVGFDPIGLRVMPGTVVRWVVEGNVHTATAYHPVNGGHPLRIPEQAEPWDSDYLVEPGQAFEVMLTAEGVYDYFCTPHEVAGMVGLKDDAVIDPPAIYDLLFIDGADRFNFV